MIKLHKSEGFSLVELMIVVAIMAILAAIAIPSYLNFQMKARESEARNNLASIKTCEESYKAENDVYLLCASSPAAAPPLAATLPWADNGGFTTMGFTPTGAVRYVYAVTVGAPAVTFVGTAIGDLDGDSNNSLFQVTDSTTVAKMTAGEY